MVTVAKSLSNLVEKPPMKTTAPQKIKILPNLKYIKTVAKPKKMLPIAEGISATAGLTIARTPKIVLILKSPKHS